MATDARRFQQSTSKKVRTVPNLLVTTAAATFAHFMDFFFFGRHLHSPLKIEDFESQGLVASSQPVFVRLLLAIYHALMSHSDMVCYFAVFILQIKSPTLASLPLSLMVFFWGTLSIPRPTKRFWVTIIAYTEVSKRR